MTALKKLAGAAHTVLLSLCLVACGGSSGDENGNPPPTGPGTTTSISQFGITWTFDRVCAGRQDHGAQALWDHDALFDYQDRYMQTTAPGAANPGYRTWNAFSEAMWDTYRSDY